MVIHLYNVSCKSALLRLLSQRDFLEYFKTRLFSNLSSLRPSSGMVERLRLELLNNLYLPMKLGKSCEHNWV